ncbi:MAG TPA: hypothetical protein PKD59_13235 [Miltoncostaeaceae bacterium]|nr:hypothetical protein [Miltoncostaeaceae bacterium]
MKPAVASALEELETAQVGTGIEVRPDPDGGAFVRVHGVDVGPFAPPVTWIAFQITWAYPDADCYPHFVSPELRYVGAGPTPNVHPDGDLPAAMSRGAQAAGFDEPAIQVSRRSNRRDPDTDSALQKLLRVIDFLRSS